MAVEVECSQRERTRWACRREGREEEETTGVVLGGWVGGGCGGQIVNGGWSVGVGQETRAIDGSGSWEIAVMCVPLRGDQEQWFDWPGHDDSRPG
jgi:hypothetical protein